MKEKVTAAILGAGALGLISFGIALAQTSSPTDSPTGTPMVTATPTPTGSVSGTSTPSGSPNTGFGTLAR